MRFLLDHDVPDDMVYALEALGHSASKLREALPKTAPDNEVLRFAAKHLSILLTCNRDDFLELGRTLPRAGIIILIRRRTRSHERAALVRLLDNAGEEGLRGNINFA